MKGDMKEQWKRGVLAVALALPLMATGYSAGASMVAPAHLSPAAAQAPLPGEVQVTSAVEVAGVWKMDTEAGWMHLYLENGHFRYVFEDELIESGRFWVQDGRLTLATKTDEHSYLVYARKEGGQPVQLRFVFAYQATDSGPEVTQGPDWKVDVDGKTLSLSTR